jgi:hypothetical protein
MRAGCGIAGKFGEFAVRARFTRERSEQDDAERDGRGEVKGFKHPAVVAGLSADEHAGRCASGP